MGFKPKIPLQHHLGEEGLRGDFQIDGHGGGRQPRLKRGLPNAPLRHADGEIAAQARSAQPP